MKDHTEGGGGLPKFSTGLNPLWASFTQRSRFKQSEAMEDAGYGWSSDFVADDSIPEAVKMDELGYRPDELSSRNGVIDDTAVVCPVRLLNSEGSQILAQVCKDLEQQALGSSFIISRRARGADLVSPFVYNMVRDRSFLVRASRIAGVPLIPHPVRDGVAQINYYGAEKGKKSEIAKWHIDGMNYVFTMLMTDPSDFDGGQFNYFLGRPEDFDPGEVSEDRVRRAPLGAIGDSIFARGSRIYHGVTPLQRGSRIVLTVSLFSPAFADTDPNSFMHIAADDGIPHTVPNWARLKWPTKNPFRDYALRTGSPVITWQDVHDRDSADILKSA